MIRLQSLVKRALAHLPEDFYTGRENLVLTFREQTGTNGDDSAGNPIIGYSTIEVKAIAQQANSRQREYEQSGVDVSRLYLKCRCIDPMTLPASVNQSLADRVPAVFTEPASGVQKTGEFFFLPTGTPVLSEAGAKLGQYFEGFFQGVGT